MNNVSGSTTTNPTGSGSIIFAVGHKGFGFIDVDGEKENLHFRIKADSPTLKGGDRVTFTKIASKDGRWTGVDLHVVGETPAVQPATRVMDSQAAEATLNPTAPSVQLVIPTRTPGGWGKFLKGVAQLVSGTGNKTA